MKKKTRIVSESGMLAAVSMVFLYLGSVLEIFDLTGAFLAGVTVLVMRIRWGRGPAWTVYAVTSVLALLIVPNKLPVVLYVFYGGLYPLLKAEIELICIPWLEWIIKTVSVCALYAAGVAVAKFVLGIPDMDFELTEWIMYPLAAAVNAAADLVMSFMIQQYGPMVARKK